MKSLQKVQNVNSDSSQEGHLLIWGHFPAQNSCQSLKVWVSHLNFCQLARQAALPEFKIEVWNSLNFWQIHHFEGLGNIWTGFVLPNLVPDWNFGTFEHTFEKSTFGIWGGVFFEVGAPLETIKIFFFKPSFVTFHYEPLRSYLLWIGETEFLDRSTLLYM